MLQEDDDLSRSSTTFTLHTDTACLPPLSVGALRERMLIWSIGASPQSIASGASDGGLDVIAFNRSADRNV